MSIVKIVVKLCQALSRACPPAWRTCFDFLDSDLVIGDFSLHNFVYGRCSRYGDRLVLVDGIGCPTFIPVKAWFPRFNRISKLRQLDGIRKLLPKI